MPHEARFALAAATLGSALVFLDLSSITLLLPVLQLTFDTPLSAVQWVVEAFILFLAALLLLGGALGDRYGRRRVFMLGAGIYAAGALSAGLAPGLAWLIASRIVQGIGAALLVPGSLALIADAYSEKERGGAFGTWAAATGFTAAGGPFLAGLLVDYASWRGFFLLGIPLAAAAIWLLTRVPDSRSPARHLDPWGATFATLGLGGLTFGLVEANARGFTDPPVVAALVTGVVALIAFVVAESRVKAPMVPLDLFRDRAFSGANFATLLLYAALSGALFFIPFNLIQVQGWSATAAGAATLPFALIMTALARPAGRLSDRIGPRWVMAGGSLLAAGGYALLAVPGTNASYWTTFFPGFVVLGIGMAALIPALTATVMNAAPQERAGIASGINNAVARAAGALAIAAFGVIAVSLFANALPDAARDALGGEVARLAAAEPPTGYEEHVVDAAFVAAYRRLMLLAAGLAAAGAIIGALTFPRGNGDWGALHP